MGSKNQRPEQSVLSTEEISYLYQEILLFVGNDKTLTKGFKVDSNAMKTAMKECGFMFDYHKTLKNVKEHDEVNVFSFSNNKNSTLSSFFAHLRNSFAHNYISKDSQGRIIFRDYYGNQLNCYARVESFEKFKQIIDCIKKIKNQS